MTQIVTQGDVMQARASKESQVADPSGRGHSFRGALALTFVSTLVPGLAHLRSGHRRTGVAFLLCFAVLVTVAVVGATSLSRQDLLRYSVQPQWLVLTMQVAALLAMWWLAVVVSSYWVVHPPDLSGWRRVTGVAVVGTLCLVVTTPPLLATRYVSMQQSLLTSVFPETDLTRAGPFGSTPVGRDDPWAGKRRVNVLLLGGDGGDNRHGVRTDSMTLASIDTRTGRTVLLSLPRNLQHVPLPPGPLRNRFPNGFNDLLNGIYQYVEEHPETAPGVSANKGAEVLKETIGDVLGVPVDYFVLVNLFGFRDIVNALGGVRIRVTEPIPYGQEGEVLEPGLRRLTGSQALWYGRSRTNSNDYTRMARQRCLLGAMARQSDPLNVLRRFQQLTTATKRVVSTDVPRGRLPEFVDLAARVRDAQVTSVQFVPPLIRTHRPDWVFIRNTAQQAISAAEADAPQRTQPSPPGTPGNKSGSKPGKQPAAQAPVSLDEVCQYS